MAKPLAKLAALITPKRRWAHRRTEANAHFAIPFALLLVSSIPIASGQSLVDTVKAEPRFRQESYSMTNPDWPKEVHHLTDQERNGLRVEWGAPRVSADEPGGQRLIVPGKMMVVDANGAQSPVRWFQPIRVLISRTSRDRPDWTERHRQRIDTATAEHEVNWDYDRKMIRDDGEFEAAFSLCDIERPLGQAEEFQIGLCLGEKGGQTITWTNTAPLLPATLARVLVPGEPVLTPELEAINGVPSPIGWEHDPAALIRAVNVLRKIGKNRAIEAIRAYVKLATVDGPEHRLAAHIDTSDQQCLCLLVPILFEREDPNSKLPKPSSNDDGYELRGDKWSYFDIDREGDIPFHIVRYGMSTGSRPSRAYLADWAEDHGRLLEKPLRPVSDPLEAADRLYTRLASHPDFKPTESEFDVGLREHLRVQAWRMVAHLVDFEQLNDREPTYEIFDKAFKRSTAWAELKARVAELKIQWDDSLQKYVSP